MVHPKGLKLQFVRDYDETCVADIREDQAEAAVKYYRNSCRGRAGSCEKRPRRRAYAKGNMRFAVWIEPGPEPVSYITIGKDEAP